MLLGSRVQPRIFLPELHGDPFYVIAFEDGYAILAPSDFKILSAGLPDNLSKLKLRRQLRVVCIQNNRLCGSGAVVPLDGIALDLTPLGKKI